MDREMISVILTLVLLLGMMPLGVWAEEEPVVWLDQTELELTVGKANGHLQLSVKDNATFLNDPIATTRSDVATATFNAGDNSITVYPLGGGETTLTISGQTSVILQ